MAESGPIPVREGDLVADKYRVGSVIGAGGMGVIYSARHEQLDQLVAIKFVRGEMLGNEEGVQRFLHEARAAAKLKSEHAARVLDVGTLESGVPYMVMELLEGCNLSEALLERGMMPVDVTADWVVQACEALAEAHAAGIVHRDLKPQNLFLARTVGGEPMVKVLDFGASKSTLTAGLGALTRTRAMLGSPLYMAPEQMRSPRTVDARTDIWALGVVLFELLTQRWPYEAETLPELCLKVVGEAPQRLSCFRPDVPELMTRVIARCLEKDVARRYANAAELASALEPLAPEGSRVAVQRARLAMAMSARPSGPTSVPGAQPPPAQGVPTPAAWGPGGRTGTTRPTAQASFLWAGLVVLGLALAGGALSLRGRTRGVRPFGATTTSPAAHVPSPTPDSSPAKPEMVTALAPLATEQPLSPVVLAAPSARATRLEPAPRGSPAAPISVRTAAASPPRPPPPVRPPLRDDDIPALR